METIIKGYKIRDVRGGYMITDASNLFRVQFKTAEEVNEWIEQAEPSVKKEKEVYECGSCNCWSLKDEVQHCLDVSGINGHVQKALPGEHMVKIYTDEEIDGYIFNINDDVICVTVGYDFCGRRFFVAGRSKKTRIC